ncbi:hypothetical protein CC86DRAFT_178998 [Ophiobolus disseminans]|uniref:Uncharacterized protein n=1 Tax=Ophiobolus disseminans TaxID=1469910 RepID=A0A6A7A9P1_9PLEO|nr:hypothetical protein CC86DRAFT_178998 [Ophiobolus disseminans]
MFDVYCLLELWEITTGVTHRIYLRQALYRVLGGSLFFWCCYFLFCSAGRIYLLGWDGQGRIRGGVSGIAYVCVCAAGESASAETNTCV